MESTMSPADVIALARDNSDSFLEGNGIVILILFFLMFGGGFGGFGRGNGLTQAEMQYGFDNQAVMSKLDSIGATQCQDAYNSAQQFNTLNTTMLTSFAGVNANINDLAHQMEQCCCNLKTQMLQDKYDAVQNQLNLAQIASANAVQTQNILNALGTYYSNPSVNPYLAYSGNGCQCLN